MPKVIVIAGGGRNVGKTRLANRLGELLPDSKIVKLGRHKYKAQKNRYFLPTKATFAEVLKLTGTSNHLIIESGSILDDPFLKPSLVIFLSAPDGKDKPGSSRRREKADLIRGEHIDSAQKTLIRQKLDVNDTTWKLILAAVDDSPASC